MSTKRKILFVLLSVIIVVSILFYTQLYPKLPFITGYTAKEVCSCTFLANRDIKTIEKEDTGFSPISLGTPVINKEEKSVTASVMGLQKRTAYYHEGFGCVLDNDNLQSNNHLDYHRSASSSSDAIHPPFDVHMNDSLLQYINQPLLQKSIGFLFDAENTDEEPQYKTRSIMVIYKDKIIGERYAKGFDRNTPMIGWSMTKSILNALFGILTKDYQFDINKDHLFSVWENDKRSKITTNHLLQMNSGLDWDEDYENVSDVTSMLFLVADASTVQLSKPLTHDPLSHWSYASGTSNLLSKLIRDQFDSHQKYLDFPYHQLFDKLGMTTMTMETDMAGNYIASSYSFASTIDWARLGMLYLQDGVWNNERILPEGWTSYTNVPTPTSDKKYGSHFWLNAGKRIPHAPTDMYSMNGYHGQRVFILPSDDLVIVRTGYASLSDDNYDKMISGVLGAISKK